MSMAFENVDYTSLDIPAAPFSDPARIPDFPKNKVPRHIGVIMDGNGRWAKQRGMSAPMVIRPPNRWCSTLSPVPSKPVYGI